MKRSEMLNKLKEVFKKHENPDNIAERALSAVEEAGMKPPDCNYHNSEYGVWDFWEEEDDTKRDYRKR
jgi:hypothetical protein